MSINYLIFSTDIAAPEDFMLDLRSQINRFSVTTYVSLNIFDELDKIKPIKKQVIIDKCGENCPYFECNYNELYGDDIITCHYNTSVCLNDEMYFNGFPLICPLVNKNEDD